MDPHGVTDILELAIRANAFDSARHAEVAFYGGTFTGLPVDRMKQLLHAVAPYIEDHLIQSIRVSTRPDFIDPGRLRILKSSHVHTVELGVQSMDDRVLTMARRGHLSSDVTRAVGLLKAWGFNVGVQLMPGLPGDSRKTFQKTIDRVISLAPDMVRLYPALVIAGTGLARMYEAGTFHPLTLEEAVAWCVDSTMQLEAREIPVIRIGLMSSPTLLEAGRIVAGPWHPAFGFLVRSAIHYRVMEPELPASGTVRRLRIFVPPKEIPLVRGHRNQGVRRIEQRTCAEVVGIEPDETVPPGRVRIEKT